MALGSAPGMIVATGVGFAASTALEPAVELPRQDAWKRNPNRILNLDLLARLVASGGIPLGEAEDEASRDGFTGDKLDALVYLAVTVPGVPEALDLWRRDLISDADFAFSLKKQGLDGRYVEAFKKAKKSRRLEPAVVALAIVRGLLGDDGILPVAPPTAGGTVPRFPTFELDAIAEAAASGFDKERLSVMVGNMGRPASPQEAIAAHWRGKIELVDYYRAIAEGDVRNEWRDAILESARAIVSPDQGAELVVRGWIDEAAGAAFAAMHGMSEPHFERLVELHGRPLTPHAVTTGLARGGHYPGKYANVPQPYRDAIRQASTREEWSELAYANRYGYPSGFQIKSEAPAMGAAVTEELLLEVGWRPKWATFFAKLWAGGSANGTAGKHATAAELADEYEGGFVTEAEYRADLGTLGYAGAELDLLVHLGDARRAKRFREKVVDAIAAAYVVFRLDDVAATAELANVHVTGAAASGLLELWRLQRLDTVRTLTPAQLKKAHKAGLLTDAAALEALEWLHYSPADAATYLAE